LEKAFVTERTAHEPEPPVPQKWSHSACFEYFGTKPKNPRWSWSGRSDDGAVVSVTLWQDGFSDQGRVYRVAEGAFGTEFRSNPGYSELIDNLEHAKTQLEGIVRVVIAVAEDPSDYPRKIGRCYPQEKLKMRVVELNTILGTFVLERANA